MTVRESPWRASAARRTYAAATLWLMAWWLDYASDGLAGVGGFGVRVDTAGLFALGAALVAGTNFFGAGVRAAAKLRLDMNFLMSVAIVAAIAIGEPFEAATLAVLFSVAELLERVTMHRGRRAITRLLELAPDDAERIHEDGSTSAVAVSMLAVGDRVRVRPGGRIAADGVVSAGESSVNEASITGESLPQWKGPGDRVFAGTLNVEGALDLTVSAVASDSTIARIVREVRAAEARRAPTETFVARFARVYTPIVTVLAVLVAILPWLLGAQDPHVWFLRGVTLLVIACPCALVIATPVTVVSALTSAARNGVLIKGGLHLEALANVVALAMDKTGTLTTGRLSVEKLEARPASAAPLLLARAAALEARSEHPIAAAIVAYATLSGGKADGLVSEFTSQPGHGLRGVVDGATLLVGTERFVGEAVAAGWGPTSPGTIAVYVLMDGSAQARITLRDTVRAESAPCVRELHRLGVRPIVMLTGDARAVADEVAEATGVDQVQARMLPEDKVAAVRALSARHGAVAMIGDGVNDAPALAEASVGIVMGAAGAPATIETADVALMGDDLALLPFAFTLARRTRRTVRLNVAVALLVKLVLGIGAVTGHVSLAVAVLVGDVGGSVLVTLNAMRLAAPAGRGVARWVYYSILAHAQR